MFTVANDPHLSTWSQFVQEVRGKMGLAVVGRWPDVRQRQLRGLGTILGPFSLGCAEGSRQQWHGNLKPTLSKLILARVAAIAVRSSHSSTCGNSESEH